MNIHSDIKQKLLYFIETRKIPHIIFHGATGCGKRHIVHFLINKIYKTPEQIKNYVMYINCAHGKGIRFIRDELKFFAKMNIHHNNGQLFKSIILFNADKLTMDAQSALRRCIEQFSHTTRFFIIIDRRNKLLKPILSRFCNIYIPMPLIENKLINLHRHNKYNIEKKTKGQTQKRERWLYRNMDNFENYNTLEKCWAFSRKLYEKAYSGLDLMKLLESNDTCDHTRNYKLLIHFDCARKEFRHDKLFIFYILVIAFMRLDCNLENIQTM